jgi:hypothetical protein
LLSFFFLFQYVDMQLSLRSCSNYFSMCLVLFTDDQIIYAYVHIILCHL